MSEAAMIALDAQGNTLTGDAAANWVWMRDPATNLDWGRTVTDKLADTDAHAAAAAAGARLPTLAELESLRDITKFKPAIAAEFASDTLIDQPYRTSDPGAEGGADVSWMVDFTYGFASIGSKTFPLRVRFVKDAA